MATKANLVIESGATFETTLTLTDVYGDPLELAGFTATSKMKKAYTSNNSISFDVSVNAEIGTITLDMNAVTTAALSPGRYVYDIKIDNGTTISRVVEGAVIVTPGVQ
jgi:hypothetical protein